MHFAVAAACLLVFCFAWGLDEAAFESEKFALERVLSHTKLNVSWPVLRDDLSGLDSDAARPKPLAVAFIHATIGIFKRRRGKTGTWGHGTEILMEMLQTVQDANALQWFHRIYVGTLGSRDDVTAAQAQVHDRFRGPEWRDKLAFVVSGESLELHEFPTLMVLQLFSNLLPHGLVNDPSTATHLLYLHTKGVRRNGDYSPDWRRYMLYMLLVHYKAICEPAMRERGYSTCGALKTPTSKGVIYAGNFWWAQASHLQSKGDSIRDLAWSSVNRYAAENYLLAGVNASESRARHYCLHHTHHDMQNCPTPPSLYDAASAAMQMRAHGNCYSHALRPQNQTKFDRNSWCHSSALPVFSE